MYLHIGKNCVIKDKDVIGIFALKNISDSKDFKSLYNNLEENNNLFNLSNEQRKTFILTKEKEEIKGYISNIGANIISKHRI